MERSFCPIMSFTGRQTSVNTISLLWRGEIATIEIPRIVRLACELTNYSYVRVWRDLIFNLNSYKAFATMFVVFGWKNTNFKSTAKRRKLKRHNSVSYVGGRRYSMRGRAHSNVCMYVCIPKLFAGSGKLRMTTNEQDTFGRDFRLLWQLDCFSLRSRKSE